jgi:hypothetical protein
MIYPYITYPLGAMTFMEEQSHEITKQMYLQLLSSGGMNHHYPTVLYEHAPFMFFGLDLPQVIDTQFIKQVKKVLVHGVVLTPTRVYFRVSLEHTHLEIGIGTPIWKPVSMIMVSYLHSVGLRFFWKFLWNHAVTLHNPDQFLPPLQREGDVFIMEKLIYS